MRGECDTITADGRRLVNGLIPLVKFILCTMPYITMRTRDVSEWGHESTRVIR